jgi:hypothetical protein
MKAWKDQRFKGDKMEELIQSIYDNPEQWKINRHTFDHSGGFSLWVSNGFIFMSPHSSAIKMNWSQKWRINKAYKWWCCNAPLASVR